MENFTGSQDHFSTRRHIKPDLIFKCDHGYVDIEEPKSLKDCITNENMVFDYYEATVATVGGDESTEYVLYKYEDDQMILALYRKDEDSEETMDYCVVPASVLDDCMDMVEKYKMRKWKKPLH